MNAPITYNYYINAVCNKLNIEKPELRFDFPNDEEIKNIFLAKDRPYKVTIEKVFKESLGWYNKITIYYSCLLWSFIKTWIFSKINLFLFISLSKSRDHMFEKSH